MISKAIIQMVMVLIGACVCTWLGYKTTQLKYRLWIPFFCAAFAVLSSAILINRLPVLVYNWGLIRLADARTEFIFLAVGFSFIFGILIPQLPVRRQRYVCGIFSVFAAVYFIVPPFLDPALIQLTMQDETWIENDVCMQTTDYTCGAASAVTALRCFNIDAYEKELAVASLTTRTWGVSPFKLAKTMQARYGQEGIVCQVRVFETLEELKTRCPAIVIVKYRPMMDHYITVLEVGDDHVVAGDPLKGREILSHAEFMEKWRHIGIIVFRKDLEFEIR